MESVVEIVTFVVLLCSNVVLFWKLNQQSKVINDAVQDQNEIREIVKQNKKNIDEASTRIAIDVKHSKMRRELKELEVERLLEEIEKATAR